MTKRHPAIPAEIDAELSPKARKFFRDLIDDYERRIAELNKRIAGLEKKVEKLTPQNSSIPPSTQHPHAKDKPKPKKPKAKTRKKKGGQPGHPRRTRPLVPIQANGFTPDSRQEPYELCGAQFYVAYNKLRTRIRVFRPAGRHINKVAAGIARGPQTTLPGPMMYASAGFVNISFFRPSSFGRKPEQIPKKLCGAQNGWKSLWPG